LKKLYFILIFSVGITFTNFAQTKSPATAGDPIVKPVKFYPNPATTVINFDLQQVLNKSYVFQVYNFIGNKVFELKSPSSKFSINLQDFFRGVYIYQIRDITNGKIIVSGKFQVVK
jgi:hypothetical protein